MFGSHRFLLSHSYFEFSVPLDRASLALLRSNPIAGRALALGVGDTFRGSWRGLLRVPPSASSFRLPCLVGGVVVIDPESSLPGQAPENPDVCIDHDSPASGSVIGIETHGLKQPAGGVPLA